MKKLIVIITACWLLSACSPEVGSEEWCKELKKKPKADWTANEARDYVKHCILK